MFVTEFGISIAANALQLKNAFSPMSVTEFGISIAANAVQS